jgi:hypothetical protein
VTDFSREIYKRFKDADGVEAALYAIACSISGLAYQLKCLGNADASTPMGAIEALGERIDVGCSRIADALESRRE